MPRPRRPRAPRARQAEADSAERRQDGVRRRRTYKKAYHAAFLGAVQLLSHPEEVPRGHQPAETGEEPHGVRDRIFMHPLPCVAIENTDPIGGGVRDDRMRRRK